MVVPPPAAQPYGTMSTTATSTKRRTTRGTFGGRAGVWWKTAAGRNAGANNNGDVRCRVNGEKEEGEDGSQGEDQHTNKINSNTPSFLEPLPLDFDCDATKWKNIRYDTDQETPPQAIVSQTDTDASSHADANVDSVTTDQPSLNDKHDEDEIIYWKNADAAVNDDDTTTCHTSPIIAFSPSNASQQSYSFQDSPQWKNVHKKRGKFGGRRWVICPSTISVWNSVGEKNAARVGDDSQHKLLPSVKQENSTKDIKFTTTTTRRKRKRTTILPSPQTAQEIQYYRTKFDEVDRHKIQLHVEPVAKPPRPRPKRLNFKRA